MNLQPQHECAASIQPLCKSATNPFYIVPCFNTHRTCLVVKTSQISAKIGQTWLYVLMKQSLKSDSKLQGRARHDTGKTKPEPLSAVTCSKQLLSHTRTPAHPTLSLSSGSKDVSPADYRALRIRPTCYKTLLGSRQ